MADSLTVANTRPARLVSPWSGSIELVGRSAVIGRVQELVRRSASLASGVLIVGEQGADIESVARELHARSRPAAAPFVLMTCGASAAAAAHERELFGSPSPPAHAPSDLESASRDSRIAAARGGTLFLADAVDLPAALQARLARVARDGEVRIDGEIAATEFRLIASAPPSIDGEVRENRFRADLYRRVAASRIDLPPLRERLEDVPALAERLLEDLAAAAGVVPRSFAPATLALLAAVNWPGNLAELKGVVERVLADTRDEIIHIEHVLPALQLDRSASAFIPALTACGERPAAFDGRGIPVGGVARSSTLGLLSRRALPAARLGRLGATPDVHHGLLSLRDARLRFERDYITAVLQHHGWRMAEAARALGIQRPNLYRKARQLGIPLARATE